MKTGSKRQISSHDKDLRVPPNSHHRPDLIDNTLHYVCERSKLCDEKNVDDQHTQESLQNDNAKVSIDILNDDCLRHIFQFLPILDRIRIERVCKRWKAVSLEAWYTMRVLDFCSSEWKSTRNLRDGLLLDNLLRRCGRFLRQLRLSNIHDISLPNDTLNTVGQFCPNLTHVDLIGIRYTASHIDALARNCKNITRLAIGDSLDNSDNELSNLFTRNNLEYLEVHGSDLSGKCLTSLSAESLRTLILCNCYYICEDYVCRTLKRLGGGLEKLVISNCVNMDSRILETISQHCINLKTLKLEDFLHDEVIAASLHFTNLVKLEEIRIPHIHEIPGVTNMVLNMVLHCRELIDVDIAGYGNLTDNELANVATLPKLQRLNISYMYDITDEGLRPFRNLKVLECRSCDITAEGLAMVLKSSPELKLLDISHCSHVDKHILKVANEVCNRRASNVILKMIIGEGDAKRYLSSDFVTRNDNNSLDIEMSPFLQIFEKIIKIDDLRNINYRGASGQYLLAPFSYLRLLNYK